MAHLDLTAGAQCWAEEILNENPGERICEGDFSKYEVWVQTKRMEQLYCRNSSALRLCIAHVWGDSRIGHACEMQQKIQVYFLFSMSCKFPGTGLARAKDDSLLGIASQESIYAQF